MVQAITVSRKAANMHNQITLFQIKMAEITFVNVESEAVDVKEECVEEEDQFEVKEECVEEEDQFEVKEECAEEEDPLNVSMTTKGKI